MSILSSLLPSLVGLTLVASGKSMGKRELASLQRISALINRSLDLKAILESALEEIMSALGMEAGAFRLVESPDAPSSFVIYRGFSKDAKSILEEAQKTEDGSQLQFRSKSIKVINWR